VSLPGILTFEKEYVYAQTETGIVLPIDLKLEGRVVSILAKLDTGASYCIFQREHGEALDINVDAGEPKHFETAAGGFDTFGHEVTIDCLGFEVLSTVYFARELEFPRNVLGRFGWIQKFRLGLIDYDSTIYLSPY